MIAYSTIIPFQEYVVDGYTVQAIPVDHTVPAVGYRVTSGGRTLVYTGDTGPTKAIWKSCSGVDVFIVEVSFPDSMEELALVSKHLTSSMLQNELAQFDVLPKRILITHPKPQYVDIIRHEIKLLNVDGMELLLGGSVYEI